MTQLLKTLTEDGSADALKLAVAIAPRRPLGKRALDALLEAQGSEESMTPLLQVLDDLDYHYAICPVCAGMGCRDCGHGFLAR